MKENVRKLVKDGRFEFVNGGWVSHDEACPTFEDMSMNMMVGHSFLIQEFNYTVRVGWQCDPFGHSGATPELYSKFGMESLFFARINDDEKQYRMNQQELEFIWRPTYEGVNGGVKSQNEIFTHVMHEQYSGGCSIDIWHAPSNRQAIQMLFAQKLKIF